jgi:hypothetical protein
MASITIDNGAHMLMSDLKDKLDKSLKRAVYAVVAIISSTEHGACDPLAKVHKLRQEVCIDFVIENSNASGSTGLKDSALCFMPMVLGEPISTQLCTKILVIIEARLILSPPLLSKVKCKPASSTSASVTQSQSIPAFNQPHTQFNLVANSIFSFCNEILHTIKYPLCVSHLLIIYSPKFSTCSTTFMHQKLYSPNLQLSSFLQHPSNTSSSIFLIGRFFWGCIYHIYNACYLTLIFPILLLLTYSDSY